MIQKNEKDENDKKQDIGGIASTITKNETLISNEALNSIKIPKKDFEELKNKIKNMSQDLEKIKKSNADLSVKFENLTKEFGVENADLEKEIDNIKKIIRFCLIIKENYGITCYPMEGHGKKNIKKE